MSNVKVLFPDDEVFALDEDIIIKQDRQFFARAKIYKILIKNDLSSWNMSNRH